MPTPENVHTPGGSPGSNLTHGRFLGTIRFHSPNGVLIGSAVFVGLIVVFNRQTDTQRDHGTSVTMDIYLFAKM